MKNQIRHNWQNSIRRSSGARSRGCGLFAAIVSLAMAVSAQDCRDGCSNEDYMVWFGIGALEMNDDGDGNSAFGHLALENNTDGDYNTAIGMESLWYNYTGNYNTAVGAWALQGSWSSEIGDDNTAIGARAMGGQGGGSSYNTALGSHAMSAYGLTGNYNTAGGAYALYKNTSGTYNIATGSFALYSNTVGKYNTGSGHNALYSNTTGNYNAAFGITALYLNTTGNENTGIGTDASFSNTTGSFNTSLGTNALYYSTTASNNTAVGHTALFKNTIGANNAADGFQALYNNTTGSRNIALGYQAGVNLTTGSDNIDIGNNGIAGESKTIRIGKTGTQTNTIIAGISGTTVAGGVRVVVDTNGRLGTINSSARYKEAIEPMDRASEAIHKLQPVTFRYKKELDPAGIPQFGLVAEEVAKVNPGLVALDDEGKPYTVRYEAVNAMLLNEFLKAHQKIGEQDQKATQQAAAISQQQNEIKALAQALKEQAAQIQKVRTEVELSTNTPRVVVNSAAQP